MKPSLKSTLFILLTTICGLLSLDVAAQRFAVANGNWTDPIWATTTGGIAGSAATPTASDAVTINAGRTITINTAASCASFTMTGGATGSTVTISGTNSLNCTGAFTMQIPTATATATFAVSDGTLTVGGTTTLSTTTNSGSRITQITLAGGTINFNGAVALNARSNQTGNAVIDLSGGAGTVNLGQAGTVFTATNGVFTAGTASTVNYNDPAAQTTGAFTYHNLTLSGGGVKTVSTTRTVNGILSIEGTATASAAVTYGADATLRYNTSNSRTAGAEWVTPFTGSGGVIIAAQTITANAAKTFNANVPLSISSGAGLNMAALTLTLGGDFTNAGTFTSTGAVTITGTATAQSIAGFTTTGTVSMTKTAGTATLTGNVSGGAFTMNGSGGTLNLGNVLLHNFTGTFSMTNGTLAGGSSTVNFSGTITATGGTFTAGTSTIAFTGAAQTVVPATFYNLTLAGSGVKTIGPGPVTVTNILSREGTATASAAPTFGANSTIQYQNSASVTVGPEFPATFSGTGGVIVNVGGTNTVTLNASKTSFAGNIDVQSGILDLGSFTINRSSAGGSLTVASGASLEIGGANSLPTNYSTHALNGTVEYNGTSSQTITATNYTNLVSSNTGARVLASTGTIGIAGNFTQGSNSYTNTGSTIDFNGNIAQVVPAFAYNNLTLSGSGSKTFASGSFTIAGDLAVNAAAALNTNNPTVTVSGDITGTSAITATSGTLSIAGDWTNNGSFTHNNGTVSYNGAAAQNVAALAYYTLDFSGAGTKTVAAGTMTVAGNWAVGSTTALNINNPAVSITGDINGSGNITSTSGSLSLNGNWNNSGVFTHNSGTVVYANATGAQSIAGLGYNNLTCSNTSGTNTAAGNISVAGTFTTSAGGALEMAANTLSVSVVSHAGLIRTQNTSASPITASKTWGGTVEFSNSTGGQSIVAGTYTNLSSSNSSGTNTATGTLTVNGVMTIATGGTVNMATFALGGTGFSTSGTGTLKTQFSAAGAVPSGITWTFAVEYSRSGNQTVATGSYSTLVTSGSGTKTLAGNTSVTSALTLTAGTLSVSTFTITLQTTSITNTTGSLNVGSGKVEFNTAGTVNLPNSFFSVTPANNVTINGGAVVNLPGTPTQQTIQGTLDITNGKLGLAENATLVISGTVANMSASNAIVGKPSASIQVIGAGATGTLYFDQTTPNSTNLINNFIVGKTSIAGTVTIGNTFKVRGVLTPTAGTVVSNGNLAIASDISGSGRIFPDINPANFQFVGDVSVERYVKSKNLRKFLFLSSPVDGVSIRNAWQDDIFITGPGTGGTPCGAGTGNGGATDKYNANGFDATIANTVSIYTYDQNNAARWVAVSNTSATLTKGKGYRVLYRGSRGVNDANCSDYLMLNSPSAPSTATMNVAGTPTTGEVFVAVDGPTTGTFGYTLLGNPYACELDFTQFRSQNNSKIAATYWTYDPNGTTNSTSYLTVNNGTVVGGYHSSNDPNDYPNPNFIASGQAFFVQTDSDTTLRFTESQKVSQNQAGVFRTANAWNSRIRVHFKQADDTFIDNVVVRFSNDPTVTIAESTEWDATTLNGGTFLATIKGNRSFAIQTRPLNFFNDTVMVRVVSAATGNFKLTFSDYGNFTEAAEIILLDLFAGTQTNVRTNPVYPFTITTSSASQGGRFRLVFRSAASVLPLSFLNISATAKQTGVAVAWKVAFEQGVNKYVVERSRNGHDFEYAGEVVSKGNSNVAVDYNFLDASPLKGTSYYRVRSVENRGGSYSEVVKVNASKQHTLISLYPNPAKDKLKLTTYDGGNSGRATVRISNAQGKTIIQLSNITTNGHVIDVSNLPNGMYFLSITGTNGEHMIEKFVKN